MHRLSSHLGDKIITIDQVDKYPTGVVVSTGTLHNVVLAGTYP
jgi:hypothetical protein